MLLARIIRFAVLLKVLQDVLQNAVKKDQETYEPASGFSAHRLLFKDWLVHSSRSSPGRYAAGLLVKEAACRPLLRGLGSPRLPAA